MKKADAVKHYGNQNRLAKALGITRQAVDDWSDLVPIKQAIKLADLTKRKKNPLRFDPRAYLR